MNKGETLLDIITRKQDELRGRPLSRWGHFVERFKYVDWWWIGFCACVVIWGLSQVVIAIAPILAR
jgi:hypothetical protein